MGLYTFSLRWASRVIAAVANAAVARHNFQTPVSRRYAVHSDCAWAGEPQKVQTERDGSQGVQLLQCGNAKMEIPEYVVAQVTIDSSTKERSCERLCL